MIKKKLFVVAAFLALFCACDKSLDANGDNISGEGTGKMEPLTFATYNVLKPSGRRTEMSLYNSTVHKALGKAIIETKADFIAFNELDETLLKGGELSIPSVCNSLTHYNWNMTWPNDIKADGSVKYSYANGFAYDKTKLKVEECGYVWLSKTENVWYVKSSSAYEKVGSPERTCIWIRMTHIASKTQFWVFVTHLPTSNQGGAANMANVVNSFAKAKAKDDPAILLGDMNCNPTMTGYKRLVRYWNDGNTNTWGTMSGSSSSYYYPVEEYPVGYTEKRIDHIMTRGCAASDYRLIKTTYTYNGQQWCPSDHLPVVATITFE